MAIAVIMTPPNYIYQRFLEDTFPSKGPSGLAANGKAKGEGKRLSKSNTLAKFCLDQSLGAMVNTAGFIVLAGLAKGKNVHDVFGTDLRRVSLAPFSPLPHPHFVLVARHTDILPV